jgi:hypothetical protein
MLTSLAIYTALGVLLNAVGIATGTAEWWCLLGLFLANGWNSRLEGYDSALDSCLIVINRLEQRLKDTHNESNN